VSGATTRLVRRASAVAVALLVCLAVAPAETEAGTGGPSRPNVIIFITDDQRADTMRVMSQTRRWFGRGGVKYANAFATTPLCCPARASIFTGRYTHNHAVLNNGAALELDQPKTLQRRLRDTGYFTALAGKYLNRWDIRRPPPHFDRFAMLRSEGDAYYDATFNVDGDVRVVPAYSTTFIRRKALAYLESFEGLDDGAPWFLVITPFAPHTPATPERRYATTPVPDWKLTPADLERDRSDKPPIVRRSERSLDRGQRLRRRQLRSLMSVDDLVHGVLRRVRRLGEATNTLSFFLSDNGILWAEHGWNQGKRVPYTPAIRIPLFARWPGRLGAGRVDHRLATNVDVAPTVFDATGVVPQHILDGRSLLDKWNRNRVLIEFYKDGGVPPWASIWKPTVQYVEWYRDDAQRVTFREYYKLGKDPWQLRNLLGDRNRSNDPPRRRVKALREQLAAARRCVGTTGSLACP
jgi:arylsulfatase A-like enzyme